MQWRGRRQSGNVVDARGRRGGGGMGGRGGGGGLGLLMLVGRMFGMKGIIAVVIIGGLLWMFGVVDPSRLIDGGAGVATRQVEVSPEEEKRYQFVKVVLADTEDVWTSEFARHGNKYELPVMTIFRGSVGTGCGTGRAETGPFYCPADRNLYIDLSFYDELSRTFNAPGDFAQAYVVAHEVGHHVQKLLGTLDQVNSMRARPEYNQLSVRLELQADFYAGVWANHSRRYLEHGDIEEAMRAAYAIGDDTIQKRTQGRVLPHAFTHGTSEQRMRWFKKGLDSGKIEDGDTFSIPYERL